MSGRIVITYAEADQPYARALADHLGARGIEVGDQFEAADAVVVVLTPAAGASPQVDEQIARALSAGKPLFGLELEPGADLPARYFSYREEVAGRAMPSDHLVDLLHLLTIEPAAGDRASRPPLDEPPLAQAPISQPPPTQPPISQPPLAQPPLSQPPAKTAPPDPTGWAPPARARGAEPPVSWGPPPPSVPAGPFPAMSRPSAAPVTGAPPRYAAATGSDLAGWGGELDGVPTPAGLEFAAAYRRLVAHRKRYPFLFFVHRPGDAEAVRAIIERRAAQLGGDPAVARAESSTTVANGTTLTIVPTVLGASFSPARVEVVTGDAVRELAFQVTLDPDVAPGSIDGYVDIFIGPLVIGQVPVTFDVADGSTTPVGASQLMEVASAHVFDKIFISYSHKDSTVVDDCVSAYRSLGVEVLIDSATLRSGEVWRAGLARMIGESDIFQLYWSTAAAGSTEVANEWRLALDLGKSRPRFIRPLYWQTPIPPPPAELGHLHFSKVDVKSLRRALMGKRPGLLSRLLSPRRPT